MTEQEVNNTLELLYDSEAETFQSFMVHCKDGTIKHVNGSHDMVAYGIDHLAIDDGETWIEIKYTDILKIEGIFYDF